MTIATIYERIQAQLSLVEDRIDEVIRTAPREMEDQLAHALSDGGKRVRPALTLLAGKFYDYNLRLLVPMAASMELLHIATLIHDDTVDESHLRHGKATINRAWGDSNAVLLGDYLFATAACMAAEPGNVRVVTLFAQTLMTICSGEIQESIRPFNESREYYYEMIGNKTAALFSTSAESGAILSGAPENVIQALKEYAFNLGTAFQIVDDILDFTGREEVMGKPVTSDLSRGVFTLPAILLLERSEGDQVRRTLEEDKRKGADLLADMISRSSVIEECYQVVQSFCARACSALEALPRDSTYDSLVQLAGYVTERGN